MIYKAKVRRSY